MKNLSRMVAAVVALVATASLATAAPSNWNVDPVHSEVAFEVSHFFTKVHGSFPAMQGKIVFDDKDAKNISVDASVNASSVDTNNERRDGHLKSADFFNVEKFPTISFKSTKVTKVGKTNTYKVEGDFTMLGVTKSVVFDAEFFGANGAKAGFAAKGTINRKDFGMVWNKTLDNGSLMLGDEVTISINLSVDPAK
jgi:polyisoprenoid-binding protein YceI